MSLTEGLPTPNIFRRWSAIACLAGAMERRLWLKMYSGRLELYPNFYILLVGPPGIGKGVGIELTEDLWRTLPDFHVAPSSVSKASLMDSLYDAKRRVVRPAENPPYIDYNSLLVAAREFQHFLPVYDGEFMAGLTDIWDSKVYEERKRGGGLKFKIERPTFNILGGTTPNYLTSVFPEGAWEGGFTSRTVIIFSGEKVRGIDPLGDSTIDYKDTPGYRDLLNDLKVIGRLFGKMTWEKEAAIAFRNWDDTGGAPIPEHPKLAHYIARRVAHLAKLCMVASVSRANDLIITLEDYQLALDWLVEAEFFMPDLFKSMILGGDATAMQEAFHFIWVEYHKKKQIIPEHRIIHFLGNRVPGHSIYKIIETMTRGHMIELVIEGNKNYYKPMAKALHGS